MFVKSVKNLNRKTEDKQSEEYSSGPSLIQT